MLRLRRYLLLIGLLFSWQVSGAAAPAPGTLITNTASGTFGDASTGQPGTLSSNTVSATVAAGSPATLSVTLTSPSASSTPGAAVTLTANVVNNGALDADPVTVAVNGSSQTLFVLNLPVPANTTFARAQTATKGAQTLYHLLGSAPNTYVTAVPAGATVDAVGWSLAALSAGVALAGQLEVAVNENATTSFSAQPSASWASAAGAAAQTTAGNTLVIRLPVVAPTIGYYTSGTYQTPSAESMPGEPLFVEVNAAACNTNPTKILTIPVTVSSRLTGDTEAFTATETAPNTGLFRILPDVPTVNATAHSGEGILEVLSNDIVRAAITSCGGVAVPASTTIMIDPSGVVYDSQTNQPVAGATVQLLIVSGAGSTAGAPARVFGANGISPAPASVVTGANGSYSFPSVAPGLYRLVVTPPGGFTFPSKMPPVRQPAGRFINAQGSYGLSFDLTGPTSGPVHYDLPVDPDGAKSGLLVRKTANKLTAQVGDFVDYTVVVNNNTGAALSATLVSDQLPAGFTYQRGSARLNGAALANPAGGGGPALTFTLGLLAKGTQATLTYRVRIGVGAQSGTGTNLAQASSGLIVSNRASATVQLDGGVFSDKAYLIGKIYADCNVNGSQDPGEPGIPGVRIYLEDGTYVVSDEEGKYSLYGLTPRMHVAKVDLTTLPSGTRLEILNNRNAFDAGSAFVDLTNGELHKTDFAVSGCSADLDVQIAARRRALKDPGEVLQAAATLLSPNIPTSSVDARTLPAAGVIRLPGSPDNPNSNGTTLLPQPPLASGMPGVSPFAAATVVLGAVGDSGGPYGPQARGTQPPLASSAAQVQADQTPGPTAALSGATPENSEEGDLADFRTLQTKLRTESLEKKLPTLDPEVGFVNLSDGDVLPTDQTPVQVKGPLGTRLELTVNGRAIPESDVGTKSSLEKTQLVAWEYVGVDLQPGRNLLSMRAVDAFGNERATVSIGVLAPGPLSKIIIEAPQEAVADGATAVAVKILLRDEHDLPIAARTELTLGTTLGEWQHSNRRQGSEAKSPTDRVFVTGGYAQLLLLPPAQPGKGEVSIGSGAVKATRSIDFTPNLRPMVGVGLVSASLNLRNLNPSALQPAQSTDVFEREIANVSANFDDGKDDAAARTALFLKGKILGSTLLTLAYDSDKPSDTTLFRDIQPDQFYPVYGDSSARGYDAQSTGKLYVMVQNGTNYMLYGDYTTQSDNPARQLTQYARALNGAKGHWQFGSVTTDGFASETSTSQSIVEFRANGTSGPFQLDLRGVTNSQQVDIITRDRNQPSVILNDTPLTQFTDYAIEPYTGLLLLTNPVPSVDSGLNPIYIHVSYSIDTGGPKHWVEGADARLQLTPGLALGATAIHDADPGNELTLEGINLTSKLGTHTTTTAEVARSDSDVAGAGYGAHADFVHDDSLFQAHLWGTRTDTDFYNPNSLQSAGESQYGFKAAYKLDAKDRIVAEGLKTSDSTTGADQTGAQMKLERALPQNAKLEVGVLHSEANAASVLSAPALPGTISTTTEQTAGVTPASAALPTGTSNAEVGYTSAFAKVTVPVPDVKGAEVFGLASKAIDGTGGEEDGIGGTYALSPTTHLYAQHDFINSLNGPYTVNPEVSQYTTVAGMSTTLPDTTQLFDEYREGDGIDGRDSEAAVGMRHQWKLNDGIGLSASLQRIAPLSGVVSDDASAATLGADYTAKRDWKASAQAQWESSSSSHTWLLTAGLAHKLDASWTLLERALYTQQTDLAEGGGRELARVQSGFAYRPVNTDVWNALAQVEYLRDFDTTLGPGLTLDELAWIAAGNVNIQPTRGWELSLRYAAKRAIDWTDGLSSVSITQLAGLRSTWDVNQRWDAGIQLYRMWGDADSQHAVGPVIGYLAWKNLWVSVGYNVQGFSAPDLSGEAYTQRGIYLHLNFKFDESLLGGVPVAALDGSGHTSTVRAP
jgi:uncharacterized repeat protein (TIGR01451 family)